MTVHLVMRSEKARGEWSFSRKENSRRIHEILHKQAAKFGVRIYDLAIVGNHFHVALRLANKKMFHRFLRAIAGLIARMITGAERGSGKRVKFWDSRPFTRLVHWGTAYDSIKRYFLKNKLEAVGFPTEQAYEIARRMRGRLLTE